MDVDGVKESVKRIEAALAFCEEILNSAPKNEFETDSLALKLKHAKRQAMVHCMELDRSLK